MNKNRKPKSGQRKSRWRLRTLIEILPVLIALTIFFSFTTIKGVRAVELFTPLTTVLGAVPTWVALLMMGILIVGALGMGWLIYLFTLATLKADAE